MFIPINTDAPLYHFPWMTIVLIVVNVMCFLITGCALDETRLEPWLLEYGNGMNPLEWLPAAFAHGGFGHLLGNMFFLWGFGIIVEGKLGWWRFLMLYLGLAIAWGFGVDLLTLHRTDAYVLRQEFGVDTIDELTGQIEDSFLAEDDPIAPEDARRIAEVELMLSKGRCLGASGVIFGLLAIALVWAPKNEIHLVGFLFYRPVSFEITILTYSLWYLALNVLGLLVSGFQMNSSGLHVVGGVAGFAAGVLYLKRGWVDCENWDLFAVMAGTYGRFGEKDWALGAHGRPEKDYSAIPVPEGTPDQRIGQRVPPDRALTEVCRLIDQGDFIGASETMLDARLTNSHAALDQDRLKRLCVGLLKAQAFDESEIALDEYIERFPDDDAWARLRLAQILLSVRHQPRAARQMLKQVKTSLLNPKQLAAAKKTAAEAKELISQGVEDEEREW